MADLPKELEPGAEVRFNVRTFLGGMVLGIVLTILAAVAVM